MPIYEYYCPDNHTVYQFYAKTLAQARTPPKCPANPKFRMKKLVSAFAIARPGAKDSATEGAPAAPAGDTAEDARMDAAVDALERDFERMDENDPKAMARMMRRMSEVSGEKLDAASEEIVRKLEEGADPESLEDKITGGEGDDPAVGPLADGPFGAKDKAEPKEPRHRFKARRLLPPRRDPKLYDF
jgi:hypothetical protein